MQAIAAAGGTTIDATTQLSVASVTATGDLQGHDVVATNELHVDGSAVLNGDVTIAGSASASGAVSLSGGGSFGGPLLRLYSAAKEGSAIESGLSNTTRTFHIQQSLSTLQFWRSLYNVKNFEISNAGHVHFYAGCSSASDQRLKTPNPPAASTDDAIAMVKAVEARTYSRLDLPDTGMSRLGFVAQEVQSACPSAWGNLISRAEHSTEPGGAQTEILTLDYARLTAVLWQCTRSLLARVELLEGVAQLSAPP